jgi:adenylylsulfate kinase-like enzyme
MQDPNEASSCAEESAERSIALRERLGRGVSVGISGVDCAGKSTVAEAVRTCLAAAD